MLIQELYLQDTWTPAVLFVQCLEWMALMLIGVSLIRSMQREKHNHAPLFNVGNCGLHSIHGAFETGMISSQWEIGEILKSMFKLFNKSTA